MASTTTKIQWTDATWNPVRGCALVSPGCTNCYAMRQAHRHSGPGRPYEGLTRLSGGRPVWTGSARLVSHALSEPLGWRAPRRVFVNSMSDLFHEDLTNEEIASVFGVMAGAPRHTFQVLTKRAERMRDWFRWVATAQTGLKSVESWPNFTIAWHAKLALESGGAPMSWHIPEGQPWPLPNVWLGVSVEDQQRADDRIPALFDTPAAVRWVSLEPQLEDVDLSPFLGDSAREAYGAALQWVVCGGESGPRARPWCVSWGANVVHDCEETSTPLFMKQFGDRAYETDPNALEIGDQRGPEGWPVHRWLELHAKKGGDPAEWPAYLRVRQWPGVRA